MIVNFLGIDHKVGTTMITQSIADAIAYNDPSLNIIRLALHNRLGLDYYPHAVGSVDDLLISLDVKYLDAEDFEAVSHKTGSLRVLGGLKDISLGRKFGIEETKSASRPHVVLKASCVFLPTTAILTPAESSHSPIL